ncbi:reverse transcriptase-like protein [Neobacillus novalis]|uniref:Reverse transcriptase-like protein n=1 Tax=Neobacillus novalis TaxID=220687 RepID=A0AA95SFB5_9BACI|nr:reverse transcriptase-like protein [Neobacillus novalis]WHY89068.1 reverse transcriptase-like protein [Neobacillus novalis]
MIEVYIDGASAGNPGRSGAGIFIKANGTVEKYSIPLGIMSNHEAEFHAFINGLKICLEKGYVNSVVSFRTDSELVNNAIEKQFVKNKLYAPLLDEAIYLAAKFELFFMKWIPSVENKLADELARLAIQKNSGEEPNKSS